MWDIRSKSRHFLLGFCFTSIHFREHKNIFSFLIITQCWDGTGSWNTFSWKTRDGLSYRVSTMAADGLMTQGARTLAAMVLTHWGRDKRDAISDDIFKRIFLNESILILIKISLKFVPKGPINNIPALVQIMAWRRLGDKPLSEPMMICLLTHICVTRPQWVNLINP